jgi:hypothetical protein
MREYELVSNTRSAAFRLPRGHGDDRIYVDLCGAQFRSSGREAVFADESPRRSVRRSWCRRDAFTSRGVVVFGSGGVRSSDLCGLWPL